MRRSLGGGGRRSMGGGGGGSGMMKSFHRAVRAGGVGGSQPNTTANVGGAKSEKSKHFTNKRPTSPNTALTLNSPSSSSTPFPSLLNLPVSAAPAPAWVSSSSTVCTEESEWECVDMVDGETAARGFYKDCLFGSVPSKDEVHHAVSALQQALGSSSRVSSPEAKLAEVANKEYADDVANSNKIALVPSEKDWLEPSHNFYRSRMLKGPRSDMVYDALHLLETEPSVQRMVISLSSDKAVWDAVLNNEAVKEISGSIHQAASVDGKRSNEASDGSDGGDNIFSWVVMFAKEKIMQLLDKITELVNNVFVEKKGNGFDEKVKSSFFISIVVVVVVVLFRSQTRIA